MRPTRSSRSSELLVVADWGTSSLRAYLLGDGGQILDRRVEPWGILQLPERDFDAALGRITADWSSVHGPLAGLASGMIGSAQGWIEVPYVDVPAGLDQLARGLTPVPSTLLRIVPGVAQRGAAADVMRGEETQILGAIAARPELADSLVVLPGTHSKWVRVAQARVHAFTTFMTGELFAVLRAHSILGRLARDGAGGDEDAAAFVRGVDAARGSRAGLAPLLFSARASVLVGDLAAGSSLDYLSGLLVGDEVRVGLAAEEQPAALIGDPALCARYAIALERFGVTGVPVLQDTAAAGLWAIAQHASALAQREPGSSRSPVSGRRN
jgi:2-dehydro-3-deoxygalactonokinase